MPGTPPALLGVVRFRQPGSGLVIGTYAFVVATWAVVAGVHARDQLGRRRHLTWPEVDRFEVRGGRNIHGARTVDGRWVRLLQFGDHARRAAQCADELETYRRARGRSLSDG